MRSPSRAQRRTARTLSTASPRYLRWMSVALLAGVTTLFAAGCGSSDGVVVSSDQTCTRQKNPPQRQPAGVSNSGWSSPRGYGVAEWIGPASSLAATIDTVGLHITNPNNQFLDNELWLSDSSNNWVETGYGTFQGGVSYSFWADNRPSTGTYYLYIFNQVTVGTALDYSITSSGSQQFIVYIENGPTCLTYTSTSNPLNTASATSDIGMEVYDSTSGAPHCGGAGLTDPSPNYNYLGLDPSLTSASYSLIESPAQSINAAMTPASGAPTTLTTTC
jgi:hypothetical protein